MVRTDGWDGGNNLAKLELVQDGSFTGGIKTHHQDTAVLLADKFTEHFAENSHSSAGRG